MKQERRRKRRGKTRPCDVRGKSKRKKKMKKKMNDGKDKLLDYELEAGV